MIRPNQNHHAQHWAAAPTHHPPTVSSVGRRGQTRARPPDAAHTAPWRRQWAAGSQPAPPAPSEWQQAGFFKVAATGGLLARGWRWAAGPLAGALCACKSKPKLCHRLQWQEASSQQPAPPGQSAGCGPAHRAAHPPPRCGCAHLPTKQSGPGRRGRQAGGRVGRRAVCGASKGSTMGQGWQQLDERWRHEEPDWKKRGGRCSRAADAAGQGTHQPPGRAARCASGAAVSRWGARCCAPAAPSPAGSPGQGAAVRAPSRVWLAAEQRNRCWERQRRAGLTSTRRPSPAQRSSGDRPPRVWAATSASVGPALARSSCAAPTSVMNRPSALQQQQQPQQPTWQQQAS